MLRHAMYEGRGGVRSGDGPDVHGEDYRQEGQQGAKESVPERIARALTTVIRLMARLSATARRAL